MAGKKRPPVTIRRYLGLKISLFIAPIILALFFSNMLAIHTITDRVKALNYNTLSLYMENMEQRLEDVDRRLYNLLVLDSQVDALKFSRDWNHMNINASALARSLNEDLAAYSTAEGMFVYSDRWDTCVNAKKAYVYYVDQEELKDKIRSANETTDYDTAAYTKDHWHPDQVSGTELMVSDISDRDLRIGAYLSVDSWLGPLREKTAGQFDCVYLEDAAGTAWGGTPPEDLTGYLEIRVPDSYGAFTLVGLVRRSTMLVGLARWQRVTMAVAVVLAFLLVGFVLFYLQGAVASPVGELTRAMQRVRDGDLDVRVEPRGQFREFHVMGECFNEMVSQINHLKISVYEEQIQKQKAELHFLQLRSGPHYYLNSLNVLYSLAMKQDLPLLKKMILILSRQSRYMLKSADTLVTMREELAHVSDYVQIQKERLPYPVEFTVEADPDLMEVLLPPLLIQTFVENSFKYGISTDRILRIRVQISSCRRGERDWARLVIADEGQGFPEKTLEILRRGETVVDDLGAEHYGIENIRQRLELTYHRTIDFELSNPPEGGARTEIWIPVRPEQEESHEIADRGR